MQAITNPDALELLEEVKKTVAPNDFVDETLDRKSELEQLRNYIIRENQKAAQKAAQEATQKAAQAAQEAAQEAAQKAAEAAQKTAEDLLVLALRTNSPHDTVEAMRQHTGITKERLAELREQV